MKYKHVDEFIDDCFSEDKYARFVLNYFRLPAVLKLDFAEFMEQFVLFCTYKGERFRCTGASRLGGIWLHSDFDVNIGYEKRVNIDDVTDWSKHKERK